MGGLGEGEGTHKSRLDIDSRSAAMHSGKQKLEFHCFRPNSDFSAVTSRPRNGGLPAVQRKHRKKCLESLFSVLKLLENVLWAPQIIGFFQCISHSRDSSGPALRINTGFKNSNWGEEPTSMS